MITELIVFTTWTMGMTIALAAIAIFAAATLWLGYRAIVRLFARQALIHRLEEHI
jgi:hypothetical protein